MTGGAAELRTAAEVRNLSIDQAQQHDAVHLQGVVTFFDETLFSRFIQDNTAGIYLRESTNTPWLVPGQLVQVDGTASPGEYAPIVVPESVRIVGEAQLPPAMPVSFEQLASGSEDSQFVEITGIVRTVHLDESSQHHLIEITTGGGRLFAYAKTLPVQETGDLVDSTVRVRGVCSTQFNRQRQLFAIRLMVPRPQDLVIEVPAPKESFSVATRHIGSLLQFTPEGSYGHRVKISGTVVYHQPGSLLFLEDGHEGIQVHSRQTNALQIGDLVEVIGFPDQGVYTPALDDSVYRRIAAGTPPEPAAISQDAALKGAYDCRLVRISATLLDRAQHTREQFLVLESDGFIFHAYLHNLKEGEDAFVHLANGSRVSVTGVCLIEPGEWRAGESWRAKSFRILLRSAHDVAVLRTPSWWTLRRVVWIMGGLLIVVLATFAWVAVLRRRVREQTGIIREQLQVEAALKQHYLDLFENANDMVFTHDLTGRITSTNGVGERLLQRSREQLLSMNLLELVAEDQRAAARHWLDQVIKGAEPATAEWDFVNGSEQRVKLEISSRLFEQNGKEPQVEGIARDVTERRRLERELLDVSNREQRRIGHDLHDGVCQQLAGIAYRVEILGDKLQEHGAPEAAEAENIQAMINDATVQARGVARGLFPVRLEENGLVSALEELADNAAARFKIACTFECTQPPSVVDNDTALHLYYTAQEALLNAARHSQATRVQLSLKPEGQRFKLIVSDNGTGLRLSGNGTGGMGIRIMRYRAKVIGATLDIRSEPGRGTDIICTFAPTKPEVASRKS